ncbi:MAG: DNA mismatch endonuclease Vsr [Oribacterium sp.]|nr:DNA mismatch endonuclease Vsr [Oribacterium sp.]
MADIKSSDERSRNMARIRSRDTKPEEYIRKKIYALGYRYRKNYSKIFGHPDVWMPKYNVAVFVNGCFWHRHKDCKYAYVPKSRVEFWKSKFDRNIERDKTVKMTLESQGIRVLVIWECTVKKMTKSNELKIDVLDKIEKFIESYSGYLEL